MNYPKYDCHKHKPEYHHMNEECDCEMPYIKEKCETPYMKEKMEDDGYSSMCLDMEKMKCKMEKECVKTYKTYYKLYKVCQYRLYKLCPCCGHEFDYHRHRGMCPRCGISM
jgi:hypothetical protein